MIFVKTYTKNNLYDNQRTQGMTEIVTTLRRPRIFGIAIFDLVGSYATALAIGYWLLRMRTCIEWIAWLLAWTAFGVIVHAMLGVPTMLGYYLGINHKPIRK